MLASSTQTKITEELAHARATQAEGRTGRARVCARRAAGWALRDWYQAQHNAPSAHSALGQLQRARADARLPAAVQQAALRLTAQVDHDHQLPFNTDPVADALVIINFVAALDKT